MTRTIVKIRLIVCLCVLPSIVSSQVLPFHYYTTKDGLISNAVRVLFQDSRGYLWIGTNDGVSVYNGTNFVNYSTVNGLGNNFINCIAERRTSPGTILIGTNGAGIARYSNGRFTSFLLGKTLSSNSVDAIVEDSRGTLWCATDGGVYSLRDGETPSLQLKYEADDVTITESVTGLLWISTPKGLYTIDPADKSIRNINFHHTGLFLRVATSIDGDVWIGTSDGMLYRHDGSTIIGRRKIFSGSLQAIVDDGHGFLFLCSDRGLWRVPKDRFDDGPIVQYTPENGLQERAFVTALFDREENFWLGSWSKGLAVLTERNLFVVPNSNLSYLGNLEASACVDSHGHIWEASRGGLWEIFKDGEGVWQKHLHTVTRDRADSHISFLAIDRTGRLWLSVTERPEFLCYKPQWHHGGPSTLNPPGRFIPDMRSSTNALALRFIDRQNRAWCGSTDGVVIVDLQTMHTELFRARGTMTSLGVRAFYQDRNDNIWIGWFADGLSLITVHGAEIEEKHRFSTDDGLPDNSIRTIYGDREGRLWVGTRYGGLAVQQGERFSAFSMTNGLLSNAVWSLTDDGEGRIWVATDAGLQPLEKATYRSLPGKSELLGKEVRVCGTYKDEFVWLVTEEAVSIFEYSRDSHNTVQPPVYITEMLVNGDHRPVRDQTELPYGLNNCTLAFVGLSFRDPKGVRYQYRLLGIDSEWGRLTPQQNVTYATLAPGSYRFEVRAVNNDGVMSGMPASISFVVLRPYWQRWWFIVSCVASLFMGIALAVRLRVKRLLQIERIRSHIATDLHDDIGASLTRITLFSDAARKELKKPPPSQAAARKRDLRLRSLLTEVSHTSRELVDSMSDIVWAVDPRNDSFENLLLRMKTYAGRVFEAKEIDYEIEIPAEIAGLALPLDFRRQLFLVFKEALSNIVRHSGASSVSLAIHRQGKKLVMRISDNGVGFDPRLARGGHGLRNMHSRAMQLDGSVSIDSTPKRGTTVELKVRIP